jgi:hypothetical protein
VELPWSDSFNTRTLSADTVTGLPHTRNCSVFLCPREDLAGAAVRGLQSLACHVLAEKDMCAVMEVLVCECGW